MIFAIIGVIFISNTIKINELNSKISSSSDDLRNKNEKLTTCYVSLIHFVINRYIHVIYRLDKGWHIYVV